MPNGTPLTFGTGDFKGFGLWGSCGHLLCGAGKRVLVSVVTKTRFFYLKKTEWVMAHKGPLIGLGSFQGVQNWSQIVDIPPRS